MPISISIATASRRTGLAPSAMRYYERIGLLPHVPRVAGQRRYDDALVHRLSLIERARSLGFRIDEIRQLFDGFPTTVTPGERWRALSAAKVAELQHKIDGLIETQEKVRRIQNCRCTSLEMCGERLSARR